MASFDSPRSLVLALPVLAAAALLVAVVKPLLDSGRLSNLDLNSPDVPDLYIQLDPMVPGRCTVTDRRESTIRRSDNPDDRRSWTFQRSAAPVDRPGAPDHWLVRTRSAPSFVLVPVEDVPDWSYAYFYRFVRAREPAGRMPPVRWTQVYVNRVYYGLFLRVELPFDPPLDRGGGGTPYELLAVSGDTMGCVDGQLRAPCGIYGGMIADGDFPSPARPSPVIGWLAARVPLQERLYLLEGIQPYAASVLPLPVSIRSVYARITSSELSAWKDDRFLGWDDGLKADDPASRMLPLSVRRELEAGWARYRDAFARALEVHCSFHQNASTVGAEIVSRLDEPGRRVIASAEESR